MRCLECNRVRPCSFEHGCRENGHRSPDTKDHHIRTEIFRDRSYPRRRIASPKRLALRCLLAAALSSFAAGSAQSFDVPFNSATPVIDGLLSTGEWAGAKSHEISMVHNDGVTAHGSTMLLMHDGTWLYLGINSGFASASHLYWAIEFDGNNSHARDGNSAEPHIDIGLSCAGPGAHSYYNRYDAYPASGSIVVPPPTGTAKASAGSNPVTFEFKIKLAELGIGSGGVSGFKFQQGTDGVHAFGFPRVDPPLADWPHLRILPSSLTDGLVAYYPFNGNAQDTSGMGNHGVVNGAKPTADRTGKANSAFAFAGPAGGPQNVTVANSPSLDIQGNTSLAISAWIRTLSQTWSQPIVLKWGRGDTEDDQWMFGLYNGRIRFNFKNDEADLRSATTIPIGVWTHVTGVYDASASEMRIYINGALSSKLSKSWTIRRTTQPVTIGGDAGTPPDVFHGDLDEVRIYSRALSSTEVSQLYATDGQTATLANVRASQRPGTKLVDISFDLSNPQGSPVAVSIAVSADNGASFTLPATSLSPANGSSVTPGNSRQAAWDAGADWYNQFSSQVKFRVIAGGTASADSAAVTVDTRNTGTRPVVQEVKSAYCDGMKHAYFLNGVSLPLEFEVVTDWNGKTPGSILFIGPWGTHTQSGTQTKRTYNVGTDFGVGNHLTVKLVATDGTESLPRRVDCDVIAPPLQIPASEFLAITDARWGICQYIGGFDAVVFDEGTDAIGGEESNIPFLGGQPCRLQLLNRVGLTIGTDGSALSSDSFNEGKIRGGLNLGIIGTFSPSYGHKIALTWNPVRQSWDAEGHIESGLSINQGVAIPFLVFGVPVFVKPGLHAQLENSETVGAWPSYKSSPYYSQASCDMEFGGRFYAAVGVDWFLNGGVFGQLSLYLNTVGPSPLTTQIGLDLDAGFQGQFMGMTASCTLWDDIRWPETKAFVAASHSRLFAGKVLALDYSEFRTSPRDYLTALKDNITLKGNGRRMDSASNLLKGNIYPYSTTALADQGARTMLAWLRDNPARDAVNRSEVVWQELTAGVWAAESAIWDDGTSDFNPEVALLKDGRAVCVWQNLNTVLTNGVGLVDVMAASEIAVAVMTTNQMMVVATNLTQNTAFDRSPHLATATNNTALVTWIQNDNTNHIGSATMPNRVQFVIFDGQHLQSPQTVVAGVGMLLSSTVAYNGTEGVFLAALDADDDPSTEVDQELWGATYDGVSWSAFARLTTNSVQDTKPQTVFDSAGRLLVAWYQDTNLVMRLGDLNLGSAAVVGQLGGASSQKDFHLVTGPAGQISMVWEDLAADGSGPEPMLLNYDAALGVWSQPLRLLANTNELERSFSGAYADNGSLLLAYNRVAVTYDTNDVPQFGQVDLMFLDYAIGSDLAVSSSDISLSTYNPAPGQSVDLAAVVRNTGELAATNVPVAFFDGNPASGGALIGSTQTVAGVFPAGSSATVQVTWVVPQTTTNRTIYVVVDPSQAQADRNRADNTATRSVLAADLQISDITVLQPSATNRILNARCVNAGVIPSGSAVDVVFRRGANNGPLLATVPIANLPTNGVYDASFEWNLAGVTFTNAFELVYVTVDTGNLVSEADEGNNARVVTVMTSLDSDGDGLLDAEELRFGTSIDRPDSDGDGLPDWGEVYQHRTSPILADSDADGMKDGDEVRAGTDPLSKDDLFAVVATDLATGHVRVQWTAKANKVYRVIKSLDLQSWAEAPSGTTPEQQSLQTAATDGVLEYVEPVEASEEGSFYRVKLAE